VKRLMPRSLAGQMAVLIGAALLLAQLVNLAYLLVQRQEFSRAQIDAPVIARFTSTAADFIQTSGDFQPLVLKDASRRGTRYEVGRNSSIGPELARRNDTETRLRQSLAAGSVAVKDVRAAIDTHPSPRRANAARRRPVQAMLLSVQLADGRWINARQFIPAPPPLITPELGLATLLIYLFLLGATLLIAARIARPLRDLTDAAEAFRGRNEPVAVKPSGPADLRNAILAFNAMNARVVRLLDEKDRMLGAIGHDLRTPLTSLRIRVETVEPEQDRERMIATIEEMSAMLEDILVLARSGRSRETFEMTDVTAMIGALADEYRELGRPVTFTADGAHSLEVQPNLLRRAVRNLIDNALKYAGDAEIDVRGETHGIWIDVLDRGPGLPREEIERLTEAFYRGEPSRNRNTGGAGLGLAIAQSIVDAHGGTLSFADREGGGFAATVTLPAGA
jgi:signal transduction histidine kinase